MSLVMKGIALLAILLTVQLTESEARKHITHKRSRFTYGGGDAVLMPRTHNFHGEALQYTQNVNSNPTYSRAMRIV